jgi:hypothetical protein
MNSRRDQHALIGFKHKSARKPFHRELAVEDIKNLIGIGVLVNVRFATPGPRLKHRDEAIGRPRHIDPTAQVVPLLHRLSDVEDLYLIDLAAIDCCHFASPLLCS